MNQKELAVKFVYHKATTGRSSNMFIDGDVIYSYSYHCPLARRTEFGLFVNSINYSSTTQSQKSTIPLWDYMSPHAEPSEYLVYLLGNLQEAMQDWANPRKRAFHISKILSIIGSLIELTENRKLYKVQKGKEGLRGVRKFFLAIPECNKKKLMREMFDSPDFAALLRVIKYYSASRSFKGLKSVIRG